MAEFDGVDEADGGVDDDDSWRKFILEREELHRRLGVPMWGYTPIGKKIESVDPGILGSG